MIPLTTILYIHHGKGLGGAPLSLLYLIQGLDKTRYKPIVLFLHASQVMDMYRAEGIEVLGPANVMDFPHTKIWWLRWYHLPTLLKAIKDLVKTIFFVAPKILDQVKPDIIHLNTSSLVGWAISAHSKKIPVAWHIREPLADGYLGLRQWFIKTCVKKYASAIIPICKNDAKPWKESSKTNVVYNAVNKNRFDATLTPDNFLQHYNLNPGNPNILYLGGLSEEKGINVILQAFSLLLHKLPNAKLLIAGTVDLSSNTGIKNFFPAARYQQKTADLIQNLGNSIKLLGTINNVPEAMAASSIIVFPATVGHFARPIIEAGFMKKPVVASSLAPLDELVIDGKTGFLVDPNQKKAWANALENLLTDHKLNQQMGAYAFDWCTSHFNVENHAAIIQTMYQTLKKEGP